MFIKHPFIGSAPLRLHQVPTRGTFGSSGGSTEAIDRWRMQRPLGRTASLNSSGRATGKFKCCSHMACATEWKSMTLAAALAEQLRRSRVLGGTDHMREQMWSPVFYQK
jgi:hypothetical protein